MAAFSFGEYVLPTQSGRLKIEFTGLARIYAQGSVG